MIEAIIKIGEIAIGVYLIFIFISVIVGAILYGNYQANKTPIKRGKTVYKRCFLETPKELRGKVLEVDCNNARKELEEQRKLFEVDKKYLNETIERLKVEIEELKPKKGKKGDRWSLIEKK